MAYEWWKDKSIMGDLAKIEPMVSADNRQEGMGGLNAEPVDGTVSRGEYVMDKPIVNQIGDRNLDKMREGVRSGEISREDIEGLVGGVGVKGYRYGGKVKAYRAGGLVCPKKYQLGGLVTGARRAIEGAGERYRESLKPPPDYSEGAAGQDLQTGTGTVPGQNVELGPGGTPYTQTMSVGPRQTMDPATLPTGDIVTDSGAGVGMAAPEIKVPDVGGPVTDAADAAAKTVAPSMEERARGIGMSGLESIAAGDHPLYRTMANLAQQQISAQGAMDEAALRQEMAQMGVTGGAANAMMAGLTRDIGSRAAGAAAQTAVAAQRMSADALKTLATEGRLGSQAERIAKGEEYANLMIQYEDALERGADPEELEAIWNNINARFPEYSSGVKPDFANIAKDYQRGQIPDLASLAGKMVKTTSFEESRGVLTDLLEAESGGMSIEDIAEQRGMSVDDLLRDRYDRIKEFGADDITRLISNYKRDFARYSDTPEEAEALENWVTEMYYGRQLEIDENGNLTTKPESELLPWNAPETAHIFDDAYSVSPESIVGSPGFEGLEANDPAVVAEVEHRQNVREARSDYLESIKGTDEQPIDWKTWKDTYEDALFNTKNPYWGNPLGAINALREGKKKATDVYMGQTVTDEEVIPGVRLTDKGTFVKENAEGDWEEYDYADYVSEKGKNVAVSEIMEFAARGDSAARKDFATKMAARSDLSLLSGLGKGDTLYDDVAKKLTTLPTGVMDPRQKGKWYNSNGNIYQFEDTKWESDGRWDLYRRVDGSYFHSNRTTKDVREGGWGK